LNTETLKTCSRVDFIGIQENTSDHHHITFFFEEVSKKENTVDFGLFFVFIIITIIIGEVFADF